MALSESACELAITNRTVSVTEAKSKRMAAFFAQTSAVLKYKKKSLKCLVASVSDKPIRGGQ